MINKNKWRILIILVVFVSVGAYFLYYYHTRRIAFTFVKEIPIPNENYDNSRWFSYHYIQNEERLMYCLIDYYKHRNPPQQGYDSTFAHNVGNAFDYEHYDYIMVYQKQLKDLTYSPYLAKKYDYIGNCEAKKPLIPTFDTVITDKVYIYRIKKNNKYRAPGP